MTEQTSKPGTQEKEGKVLTVDIDLDFPVQINGIETDRLTMRRPKLKDQLRHVNSDLSQAELEIRLFADLCEVSYQDLEELDMVDYAKVQKGYGRFLSSPGKP